LSQNTQNLYEIEDEQGEEFALEVARERVKNNDSDVAAHEYLAWYEDTKEKKCFIIKRQQSSEIQYHS